MTDKKYICRLCGGDAMPAEDGNYRHANSPLGDVSTFCDKYGYPIPVGEDDGERTFMMTTRTVADVLASFPAGSVTMLPAGDVALLVERITTLQLALVLSEERVKELEDILSMSQSAAW